MDPRRITADERLGRIARQLLTHERRAALHGIDELGPDSARSILESARRLAIDEIERLIDELDDPFLRTACAELVDCYRALPRAGEDRVRRLPRAIEILGTIPCDIAPAVAMRTDRARVA